MRFMHPCSHHPDSDLKGRERDTSTCVDYVAGLWQWWRLLGWGLHSVQDNIHIELIAGAM